MSSFDFVTCLFRHDFCVWNKTNDFGNWHVNICKLRFSTFGQRKKKEKLFCCYFDDETFLANEMAIVTGQMCMAERLLCKWGQTLWQHHKVQCANTVSKWMLYCLSALFLSIIWDSGKLTFVQIQIVCEEPRARTILLTFNGTSICETFHFSLCIIDALPWNNTLE